ncbi:MAG: TetR/AcrR family transcriptional regulator [Burkholderiales bacterium]|nr:MAG: TetR/AcrR family transcriptional regulator [Burkholderiales bacterium]
MTETRRYVSPKREAQAAATREAILGAFAEQMSEPGRIKLSPSEAAMRAGVSLRTVHVHFPNEESQVVALGEWFDQKLYPQGVVLCAGPDDLARYFRDIHRMALKHPFTRALVSDRGVWRDIRKSRRTARLEAIRHAVKAIGAPKRATEGATAQLLALSGADASLPMHDHGLPLERVPDVIANTVQLIVNQLKEQARKG